VDLDQVDVVGPQPLQAGVDLGPRLVAVAQAGLGGQEDPVADLRHPRPQAQLRVAVAGGDVEVVDAGVQSQADGGVGGVLVGLAQGGRPVDQDRALVAKSAQSALLHGTQLPRPVGDPVTSLCATPATASLGR
jgi:hypothetical protein